MIFRIALSIYGCLFLLAGAAFTETLELESEPDPACITIKPVWNGLSGVTRGTGVVLLDPRVGGV